MKHSGTIRLRYAVPLIICVAALLASCVATKAQDTHIVPLATGTTASAAQASTQPAAQAQPPAAKPMFVEFYTTWCLPCRQMEPVISRLQDEYGNRVDFNLIDAAGASEEKAKYHYVSQPQIVLVDREGKIVDTIYGYQGYDGLKKSVQKLLALP